MEPNPIPSAVGRTQWLASNKQNVANSMAAATSEKWKSQSLSRSVMPTSFATLWTVVHGIFQARILEWVAIFSSRASSRPKDWTWVSWIAGRFFVVWATGDFWNQVIKGTASTLPLLALLSLEKPAAMWWGHTRNLMKKPTRWGTKPSCQ